MYKTKGSIRAIHNQVIIRDMHFGERVSQGGIILLSDDGKNSGIRPRWGRVHVVGPEQLDIKPGQWVLVEHGRWTRGFELTEEGGENIIVRRVDVDGILAISDEQPSNDDFIAD